MRKDEVVKKNISLVFDLLRYLTDHPELIEKLPDGCELEFLRDEGTLVTLLTYSLRIPWLVFIGS
jgi:hypothetical protein